MHDGGGVCVGEAGAVSVHFHFLQSPSLHMHPTLIGLTAPQPHDQCVPNNPIITSLQ